MTFCYPSPAVSCHANELNQRKSATDDNIKNVKDDDDKEEEDKEEEQKDKRRQDNHKHPIRRENGFGY